VKKHSIHAALALTALVGSGAVPALAANPVTVCTIGGTITNTVTMVYFGATAPIPSIEASAANLYGPALSDCGGDQRTYRGNVDTNNDGLLDTCVTLFMATRAGSCEGVQMVDRAQNSFNVCPDTSGATTPVSAASLGITQANIDASDVSASLCSPVIGGFTRPTLWSGPSSTGNRLFAIPFTLIAHKNLRALLPASKVVAPPVACPTGPSDCPKVDVSISKDKLKGMFGNNDECDWRYIDSNISDAGLGTPIIGTVMRNRLSGTRNSFNATILQNLGAGQGNVFEAGTGDVINRVKANRWCGTDPAECGESGTGVIGGQTSPCQGIPTPNNPISLGYVGADQHLIVDPGTPANPFDDYAVRKVDANNYDVLEYEGHPFNKASVQCGEYEWWSYERMYYDSAIFVPGVKKNVVTQFISRVQTDAQTDPTVVALTQMQVSRANDGSPTFPSQPYTAALCHQP
jgi:hypothetical protein